LHATWREDSFWHCAVDVVRGVPLDFAGEYDSYVIVAMPWGLGMRESRISRIRQQ
jgi:hypothetical protein